MAELGNFGVLGMLSAFLTVPVQKASKHRAWKLCKEEPLCRVTICKHRTVAAELKF